MLYVDDAIRACGGTKTPIELTRFVVLGMDEVPAPRPEVSEQGVWNSRVVTA